MHALACALICMHCLDRTRRLCRSLRCRLSFWDIAQSLSALQTVLPDTFARKAVALRDNSSKHIRNNLLRLGSRLRRGHL